MKKCLTLIFSLIIIQLAFAQQEKTEGRIFKKFKVDVSGGYAVPQSTGNRTGKKAGALFAIEPKYAVMDQLSLGLRLELEVTANIDVAGNTGSAKANGSYLATGDYYFTNTKLRPFAGIGGGMFTTASVDTSTIINSASDIPQSTKFGFMARGGFEYGHLRIGLEYNFVADKSGYLGIKLGACIGGGRKK